MISIIYQKILGWENPVKTLFGGMIIGCALIAVILMLVVMCNIHTSALRKRTFVRELSAIAQGLTFLVLLFAINWFWFPLVYLKFDGIELPDFYPAFQVLNSWMGFFAFIGIAIGSPRFRSMLKQRGKSEVYEYVIYIFFIFLSFTFQFSIN